MTYQKITGCRLECMPNNLMITSKIKQHELAIKHLCITESQSKQW